MRLVIVEFFGSLIFILCWLIIRNYKIPEGQIQTGFQNLVKPALIYLAYIGGSAISGNASSSPGMVGQTTYGGFKNPTLAL